MRRVDIEEALVAAGIAGPHRSHDRRGNLAKIRALRANLGGHFGLSGVERYDPAEILSLMSRLTGCSAGLDDEADEERIDPALTVEAIVTAAERLRVEATRGAALLACTGHPTGLLEHHIRVVDAYRRAGGKVLQQREEERFAFSPSRSEVRYVGGVGCLSDGASLRHTHSAALMETLLETEPWPEIVLADHGFAGAAIERGIPTIAVMDINDHPLVVPWAEGKDVVILPMDDNRPPKLYEPSWRLFEEIIASPAS